MSDAAYVVQKVEWYQLRSQDGTAFFVMVSTLPNGFVTARAVRSHDGPRRAPPDGARAERRGRAGAAADHARRQDARRVQ